MYTSVEFHRLFVRFDVFYFRNLPPAIKLCTSVEIHRFFCPLNSMNSVSGRSQEASPNSNEGDVEGGEDKK